jgi:hypothetical protein
LLLTHTDTHTHTHKHTVEIPWRKNRLVAGVFTWRNKIYSQRTHIYAPGDIQTLNTSKGVAAILTLWTAGPIWSANVQRYREYLLKCFKNPANLYATMIFFEIGVCVFVVQVVRRFMCVCVCVSVMYNVFFMILLILFHSNSYTLFYHNVTNWVYNNMFIKFVHM